MTEGTKQQIDVCAAGELPSGEMRLVEAPTGPRSASSTATARSTRSRTAARTTTARSPRARSTRTPVPWSAHATGLCSTSRPVGPKTLPAYQPVPTYPVTIEDDTVKLEVA